MTRSALGSTYPSPHAAQSIDTVPPRSLERNRGPGNSSACRQKIDAPRLLVKEPSPWQNLQITNVNSINQTNTGFFGVQSSLSHVRQLTKIKTKSHAEATVVVTGSTAMTAAATLSANYFPPRKNKNNKQINIIAHGEIQRQCDMNRLQTRVALGWLNLGHAACR